jgi:uncharacterized protein (UPF0262 family)
MVNTETTFYIYEITLDEASTVSLSQEIKEDRRIAVADLMRKNHFRPLMSKGGPYHVHLVVLENRLHFHIHTRTEQDHELFVLPLSPFRGYIRDYLFLCESYHSQDANLLPGRIEAMDMGRRALHNEWAEDLIDRMSGDIEINFETARGLVSLICALRIKD